MQKHFTRGAPPLLIAMGLLLLVACKKDAPEPVVEGTVMEAGTGVPLVGAKVQLLQYTGEFLGSTSFDILDQTTTDENGQYQVRYTDPDVVLSTIAYMDGYFTDDDNLTHVGSRPDYDANIVLHPYAWLRVKIRNESGLYGFGSSHLLGTTINQLIGEEIETILLEKGYKNLKILFFLLESEGNSTTDISSVKVIHENGSMISLSTSESAISFQLEPIGHDTTDITIIY